MKNCHWLLFTVACSKQSQDGHRPPCMSYFSIKCINIIISTTIWTIPVSGQGRQDVLAVIFHASRILAVRKVLGAYIQFWCVLFSPRLTYFLPWLWTFYAILISWRQCGMVVRNVCIMNDSLSMQRRYCPAHLSSSNPLQLYVPNRVGGYVGGMMDRAI